jgi:hypothetical protein
MMKNMEVWEENINKGTNKRILEQMTLHAPQTMLQMAHHAPQHLSKWPFMRHNTSVSVFSFLRQLGG